MGRSGIGGGAKEVFGKPTRNRINSDTCFGIQVTYPKPAATNWALEQDGAVLFRDLIGGDVAMRRDKTKQFAGQSPLEPVGLVGGKQTPIVAPDPPFNVRGPGEPGPSPRISALAFCSLLICF